MAKKNELLDEYFPETEMAEALGKTPRTLRKMRQRREGPPWVKQGRDIYYPKDLARDWLKSLIQVPARSRRAA